MTGSSSRKAIPVLQQKGSQHVGSVLCLDLVRDDHLLYYLVGYPRQGLLIEVQEHSSCNNVAGRACQPRASINGGEQMGGRGDRLGQPVVWASSAPEASFTLPFSSICSLPFPLPGIL